VIGALAGVVLIAGISYVITKRRMGQGIHPAPTSSPIAASSYPTAANNEPAPPVHPPIASEPRSAPPTFNETRSESNPDLLSEPHLDLGSEITQLSDEAALNIAISSSPPTYVETYGRVAQVSTPDLDLNDSIPTDLVLPYSKPTLPPLRNIVNSGEPQDVPGSPSFGAGEGTGANETKVVPGFNE
jgi:hypothetical protein